jgi:ParB-like chromosome segregation protein Spo0J
LIENVQRAALQPLEEGRALRKLMDEAKLSIREAARWLGKDKSYVENRLRLLNMGPDVHEMLNARPDTIAHARLIDAVTDPDLRADLIRAVVEDGIGEREIRRRISGPGAPAEPETGVGVSLRKDTGKSQTGKRAGTLKEEGGSPIGDRIQPVSEFLNRAVLETRRGSLSQKERALLQQAIQDWKQKIEDLEQILG